VIDEVEIAPNLFYLSGGEEIVSSLEMSCRMGYDAARELSRGRWDI
jgi:prenylcysteine oxidase/farnesylcysteine lyase